MVSTLPAVETARDEFISWSTSSLGPVGRISKALLGVNSRMGLAVITLNLCALSLLSTSAPIVGFQTSMVKGDLCEVTTLPRIV